MFLEALRGASRKDDQKMSIDSALIPQYHNVNMDIEIFILSMFFHGSINISRRISRNF